MPNRFSLKAPDFTVPVMKPSLPAAAEIVPWIEQIDANRYYSNFGPLYKEFKARLAEQLRIKDKEISLFSNGTAALKNALRALELPERSHVLLPSWTFVATPAAVVEAGLVPYFLDVEKETQALSPQVVQQAIKQHRIKASAVVVVAPFGAPIPVAEWEAFSEETGVRVIIDAAAAFDAFATSKQCQVSKIPVIISLHATKSFGIGEGGILACRDEAYIERARQMGNFGFCPEPVRFGGNDKMSEYHAAVGLSALDAWPHKRKQWQRAIAGIIRHIAPQVERCSVSTDWVGSACMVSLPGITAQQALEALEARGIEGRKWWREGCHRVPAYAHYPRTALPVTETLADTMFGIPLFVDITEAQLVLVAEALQAIRVEVDAAIMA